MVSSMGISETLIVETTASEPKQQTDNIDDDETELDEDQHQEETKPLIPSNSSTGSMDSSKDSPASSSSLASSPNRHQFLLFRGSRQQQQQQSQQLSQPAGGRYNNGTKPTTTSHNTSVSSWIERIESFRVSSNWARRLRIEPETPWIQGLESVYYDGRSCADAIRILGYQPPRYLWYMISGGICDIIQFLGNVILYYRIAVNVSMAWAIGFITVIPVRHTTHRYLVFGDYVGGYYHSLARMYAGYSVTIVASTILNYAFSRHVANMPLLYAITMIMTGVANYFILKRFWNIGSGGTTTTTATSSSTELSSLPDSVV